jgi:hypothetical protein
MYVIGIAYNLTREPSGSLVIIVICPLFYEGFTCKQQDRPSIGQG